MLLKLFLCSHIYSQSAFHNNGNVQIHENGAIGFHIDLVNDGIFNKNQGLTGFYSKNGFLSISGENSPIFKNLEVDVSENLFLYTCVGITKSKLLITGLIVTPRENPNISLDFINYDVYAGEGDFTHVKGYVSVLNEGDFVFPIGDNNVYRPMILPNQLKGDIFKGAYFSENPNFPTVFDTTFDTSKKQLTIDKVNEEEYWDLDGTNQTTIILTWNYDSNINLLSTNISSLRVVGSSVDLEKWVDLGQKNISGNLEEGQIESELFIPNNYEVITIGSDSFTENSQNYNFGFSPNGDGINDTFVVDGIESRPNNTLYVYNRWGALVYSKKGYDNSWGGISTNNLTIYKNKLLPVGTYFYILKFHDERKNWEGYIYINR